MNCILNLSCCTSHFTHSFIFFKLCPSLSSNANSHCWLCHHLRTRSLVIRLYILMPWSWVHIEYNKHRVKDTPSALYAEYSIHRRITFSQPVSFHCHNVTSATKCNFSSCCTSLHIGYHQLTNHASPGVMSTGHIPIIASEQTIELCLTIHHTSNEWPQCHPPPRTSPISVNHVLQVNLCFWILSTSKYISKLTGSQSPNASLTSTDDRLQVHISVHSV